MKKGKKYAFIGLIVLVLIVLAVVVFSSNHLRPSSEGISERVSSGGGGFTVTLSPFGSDMSDIYDFGDTLGEVRGNYQTRRRPGVSHVPGEVESTIFAYYLNAGGVGDNKKLFSVSQLKTATYVVPLISGATCNDLCRYTLGGQCKGVANEAISGPNARGTNYGGRWVNAVFDSTASASQGKLVLRPGSQAKCNENWEAYNVLAMCFCGS